MIIDYTNRDLSRLEHLITKNDGTPLQGEIDMYRRIVHDCEKSSIMWHFWHDIRLHITSGRAGEIQIDFLPLLLYLPIFYLFVNLGRLL